MRPTDDTVRLTWEEVVGSDRMCRYYGHLSQRRSRVSELLAVGIVGAASGAVLTLLSRFPDWVPAAAAAAAALARLILGGALVGRVRPRRRGVAGAVAHAGATLGGDN